MAKSQKGIIFIDWNDNIIFQNKTQNLINFFITTSDIKVRKQFGEAIETIYKKYKNKNSKIEAKTQNQDKKNAITTNREALFVVSKEVNNAK